MWYAAVAQGTERSSGIALENLSRIVQLLRLALAVKALPMAIFSGVAVHAGIPAVAAAQRPWGLFQFIHDVIALRV